MRTLSPTAPPRPRVTPPQTDPEVHLTLPPELVRRLQAAAFSQGTALEDFAQILLEEGLELEEATPLPSPPSGTRAAVVTRLADAAHRAGNLAAALTAFAALEDVFAHTGDLSTAFMAHRAGDSARLLTPALRPFLQALEASPGVISTWASSRHPTQSEKLARDQAP